ncbi:hypothetical protein E4K64_25525 [Bradyrhizobium frederickii]|uniref:DNA primase/polymerase bifunctional N-terminal domain-containing protein n=1 Tax=Bradyrhizobium frederickii TaxID=2560054 RepID=A0A4Y9NUR6_9BRAD|nr:hypothetical protein E4K64_25525 [Bradyrhizobium frederickii]
MNAPLTIQGNMLLRAALDYAERGFPVFPCSPKDKRPLVPREIDPHTGSPIEKSGGLYKATTDAQQITTWWTKWPNAMIGVPMGPKAGIWAIDPDAPKEVGAADGREYLAKLQIQHGDLPTTHTHLTPGGGKHMLFRWRDDKPITNREGALSKKGINVRGDGGYLIFPPSQFFDGKHYEVEEEFYSFHFADAPDWLYNLILAQPEPKISDRALATVRRPERSDGADRSAYAEAALDGEIGELSSTFKGDRNNRLNVSAVSLGTLVATGLLDEGRVIDGLISACAANGLLQEDGRSRCMATIKSGLSYGLQHPRSIQEREYRSVLSGGPIADYSKALRAPSETGNDDAAEAHKPPAIVATPYKRVDPKTIPLRDWIYGSLLIRKFVTATVSPGGIGKSSLVTVEALAMASGRGLLGVSPKRRMKVWLWNLEDPQEETARKIEAAALHYGLSEDETDGYLFVNSGRDTPLVMAKELKGGAFILAPVVDALVEQCRANAIDVLVIDPFVSSHEVGENNNTFQDMIIKEWGRVAERANVAVHLVDHTRKMSGGETEITTESSRGAKAKTDGCRVVRVVNRMTDAQAVNAGIENPRIYFRTFNDKANLAPPADKSDWFKLESVDLGNAPSHLQFGDSVGVVTTWEWPDALEGVNGPIVDRVFEEIKGGTWRESSQSPEWVGIAVARVLGLDVNKKTDKARIAGMVRTWRAAGSLVVVEGKDAKGKPRPFIEVAEHDE